MVTSKQALAKYGDPNLQRAMVMWDVPGYMEIGVFLNVYIVTGI